MKATDRIKKVADSSVDATKKIVGYEDAKSLFGIIKDMASYSMNPFKKTEAREETFEQAVSRFRCSESEIAQAFKMCRVNFYVNAALAIALFIYACSMLFFAQTAFPAVACVAILLMNLALMFKYSFRAYQIKHRKLCPVSEWLQNSREWII